MSEAETTEPCLERVADGWRWRASPNGGLGIGLRGITAFLGLLALLMAVLEIKLAVSPDQLMRGPLLLFGAAVIAVCAFAIWSCTKRLLPWREAVFVVDGDRPHVRLSRGRRRRVIALAEVRRVRVMYSGPSGGPWTTYLEVFVAGGSSSRLVGPRGYEPTAAADLRRLLPDPIDVATRFDVHGAT